MSSLQDQLLKAGLVDAKQAKNANKQKRKADKIKHKSNQEVVDENKEAVLQSQKEKAERDRALNAERDAKALQKAIEAQIKQLVELNKKPRSDGDIAYNFKDGVKIKKIYIKDDYQRQLTNGLLAIVSLEEDHYELVPSAIAEKIAERDSSKVIVQNEVVEDEDDPYAEYQIPDDLMW